MKRFKHSGAFGDLIYSLPIMKHFGGGEFYLHLNQIDWVGQHYYGSPPNPFHRGRLTEADANSLRPLLEAQDYVTKFDIMQSSTEITHNLDRFRAPFVGHPGNYVDIYADVFGLRDPQVKQSLRETPWLTVPTTTDLGDRRVVINRTQRWIPPEVPEQWAQWKEEGAEAMAIFVGSPEEYELFKSQVGWDIPYHPTQNLLELAQAIAGAEQFIGNQSVALSLAIGLGVEYCCEIRRDLPTERNECYFPNQPGGDYF